MICRAPSSCLLVWFVFLVLFIQWNSIDSDTFLPRIRQKYVKYIPKQRRQEMKELHLDNLSKTHKIPYLPEYKSQLQHLFLLLISRVRLILRMFRILRSTSRTESETSPLWAWSRTVVQRMRKCTVGMRTRWRMHARKRRWRSG